MSDGMAEELLNLLAKVPDLKVIARTSSFAFKGEKIEIAEIAKKLNVAHVLEGSVRTSGNKLRITAQLVRASDSTHLWSETYDRPLDDIFAVQDEIANAIVQALQIRLMGGTAESPRGRHAEPRGVPVVPAGLECRKPEHRSRLWTLPSDYLEQAIKLDPSYGMAWSCSGESSSLRRRTTASVDATEGYERARQLAQHALQLSPDLADAHAAPPVRLSDLRLGLGGRRRRRAARSCHRSDESVCAAHSWKALCDARPLGRRRAAISCGACP